MVCAPPHSFKERMKPPNSLCHIAKKPPPKRSPKHVHDGGWRRGDGETGRRGDGGWRMNATAVGQMPQQASRADARVLVSRRARERRERRERREKLQESSPSSKKLQKKIHVRNELRVPALPGRRRRCFGHKNRGFNKINQ